MAHQIDEFLEGIVAVARLSAVPLRRNDEDAFPRETARGDPFEPRAHVGRERWRVPHVKAQLDRGRDLVDILPTWAGRANEALLDFAFVEGDLGSDANDARD